LNELKEIILYADRIRVKKGILRRRPAGKVFGISVVFIPNPCRRGAGTPREKEFYVINLVSKYNDCGLKYGIK